MTLLPTSPGVSIYVVNTPILAVPSTASGTQVGLDVLPAVGVTGVAFSLSGAGCPSDDYGNDPNCVLTATPTNYRVAYAVEHHAVGKRDLLSVRQCLL